MLGSKICPPATASIWKFCANCIDQFFSRVESPWTESGSRTDIKTCYSNACDRIHSHWAFFLSLLFFHHFFFHVHRYVESIGNLQQTRASQQMPRVSQPTIIAPMVALNNSDPFKVCRSSGSLRLEANCPHFSQRKELRSSHLTAQTMRQCW